MHLAEYPLIPERGTVKVFAHVLKAGPIPTPCFTYVSSGLEAMGQDEIAVTIRADLSQPPPLEPVMLMRTFSTLAAKGRTVGTQGVTDFGPDGALGFPALRGFAYCRAAPMDAVDLPPRCLSAISLVGDELAAVQQSGTLRLLARLGRAARFYPVPPWIDAARAELTTTKEESMLFRLGTARISGLSTVVEGNRIILRVARKTLPVLARVIPTMPWDAPFALLTELDSTADGCFVWTPGQNELQAVTPQGSQGRRLAGNFVILNPRSAGDGAGNYEDGFAALLSNDGYAAVRRALTTGASLELSPRPGEKSFAVEWFDPDG